MNNLKFRYDQTSVRLEIEGLPDSSIGQDKTKLGIVSSWRLDLVGSPQLEGRREHLQSLIDVVYPYVRYRLSGISKSFVDKKNQIKITSSIFGTKLLLTSSQANTDPLTIELDDAELSDLLFCLDSFRHDPRVEIDFSPPPFTPLPRSELLERIPFYKRFGASLFGITCIAVASMLFLTFYDEPQYQNTPSPEQKIKKSL